MTDSDTPSSNGIGNWNLATIVNELREVRADWRGKTGRSQEYGLRELPSRSILQQVVRDLCGALFPMRLGPHDLREEGEDYYVGHTLDSALNQLQQQVLLELKYTARQRHDQVQGRELYLQSQRVVKEFAAALPGIRRALDSDVNAAYLGDPAARYLDEVLLCYPGVAAMIHHRLAHQLYKLDIFLLARMIAELAHSETGIDIHPGATIGRGCFIDHGTGVVIGETAIIGARVRIYQAVTLGAKSFPANEDGALKKGLLRHPVVEDDVVIYAGATVLGRVTIGRGSVIGGNVWVTASVPPGSVITQANLCSTPSDKGHV